LISASLTQLLRQQGFEVAGGDGNVGARRIILRGMGSNSTNGSLSDISNSDVLVLLNGRRLGGTSPDFIGLANVERIEIIRGPAAVQYGPSATAGVVNIITRRGGEKTEIRAEAGMGSYDLSRFKLAASGQSNDGLFDFSFGAGQQYRGDYKVGGPGFVLEGSRSGNQYGFNGDFGINFREGHRIGFNYNYSGVFGAESPDFDSPYISHENPKPVPYKGLWSNDATNSNMAITYDGSTEDNAWNWQSRVSFGRFEHLTTPIDKPEFCYDPGSGLICFPNDSDTYILGMKNLTATLGYDDGGLFAMSGGLDYLVYEMDFTRGSNNTQPEYKDFGVFLSGKLRFLDDSLIFSAGGRFDSYKTDSGDKQDPGNKSETNFSPSVGLAWLPVDWLKLRGNYSQGFKMPDPFQTWGDWMWTDPNPDIKPEKTKTWEVGLDVNWEFVNSSLTYFRTKWDDKIHSVSSKGPKSYQYVNLRGATIAGYELALSADLGQAFHQDFTIRPYVNLTYLPTLRNEDLLGRSKPEDDTLTYVSKMTMSYGLDFIEPNIDLMANINARYLGEKLTNDYSKGYSTWMYYTPGTIVDMSVEKGIVEFADMGKMKVRAEVNNLFDKYDEGHPNHPRPGRNFYVGMVYQY